MNIQTIKPTLTYDSLDHIFNQELIDRLPGAFYLYELVGEAYKMTRCNAYHLEIFNITKEEAMGKSPYYYMDPKYHSLVEQAIDEMKANGEVSQVYANVITKEGESIPFIFQGYKLYIEDKEYYAGVSINISDLISVKQQLKILELKTDKIISENKKKEKQLLALALQENQNDRLLHTISNKTHRIMDSDNIAEIKNEAHTISTFIRSQSAYKDNWENFKDLFVNIHRKFFTNLKSKHPDLTENEMRYCAYLKINMSNNDLCSVLNISKDGLKKKQYRLRKKLNLKKGKHLDLKEYIATF